MSGLDRHDGVLVMAANHVYLIENFRVNEQGQLQVRSASASLAISPVGVAAWLARSLASLFAFYRAISLPAL